MKKIKVTYSTGGKILTVDDTSAYFEQENLSLQIDAEITTEENTKVRAYIKAPNGNSTIIPGPDSEDTFIQPKGGVYSVVIESTYMAKGTLYVGFEVFDDNGYIERYEPLKVYIDSFVNSGGSNTDNVYVVTVEIDNVETLPADGQAYVENVGTKKDVKLKFGIPQGIKGDTATVEVGKVVTLAPGEQAYVRNVGSIHDAVFEIGLPEGKKGDKGEPFTYENFTADQLAGLRGEPGYTPVAGKDFYTPDEKVALVNEVISSLPVDDRANHESPNFISNGAITAFVLERFSEIVNNYDQNYNPQSMFPQSGKAVDQAIAQLLGSAPENLDTLEELAKALQNDESFANKIIDMISGKVDKKDGYGLSKNDFTDTYKKIVNDLAINFHTLDTELSTTSKNPVQNKAIADAVNKKMDESRIIKDAKNKEVYLMGFEGSLYGFKDARAREKILDLEDRKANVFSMSAKGENINIKDSADSKLNSLKIYGKSKQNKYSGKNLFRILETPQTKVGVTLSYDKTDDTFVLNGTSTSSESFEVVPNGGNYGEIKANDYYTLSFVEVSGSKSNAAHIFVADSVNTSTYFALSTLNSTKKQTKQYTSDCYIKRFAINVPAADITYTNYKFRIQFEKGQSNTPFEPYVGGKASPSPEYPQEIINSNEINLNVANKNFLSDDVNNLSNWTNPSLSGANPELSYDFYLSLPTGEYVFDVTRINNSTNVGYVQFKKKVNDIWILVKDFTINTTISSITKRTFTIEEGYEYKLWYYQTQGSDYFSNLTNWQIRRVDDAENYVPHNKQTLSIPGVCNGIPVSANGNYTDANGQQWICDEIDFARGVHIQRIAKIILNGTENWKSSENYYNETSNSFYLQRGSLTPNKKFGAGNIMSDKLSFYSSLWSSSNIAEGICGYEADTYYDLFIRINNSRIGSTSNVVATNVALLKEWLQKNPITVIYEIAEPIETQLTEEQIFAYKALQTYKPVSNIYTLEGAGIEVEYVADTKTYIDNKFAELQTTILNAVT